MRTLTLALALGLTLSAAGCLILYRAVDVEEVDVERADPSATFVASPVRLHMTDGSAVIFSNGIIFEDDRIAGLGGPGSRSSPTREGPSLIVQSVPLDSVLGGESYGQGISTPTSVALSVMGTVTIGIPVFKAIFGSCPTVYVEENGEFILEAELFSNSFAPLLEARDVHRLNSRPDADGILRLEVRNEALETHFIDHMELLEVRHGDEERAVPDERSRPLVLSALRPPARATDRAGRDVAALLARGEVFETDPIRLAAAGAGDPGDHIDLVIPVAPGADSVAVLLHLRNSLLTTVLMYDVMLGPSGVHALEWMGRDLQQIGPALELGQWATSRLGMRVSVREEWGEGEEAWRGEGERDGEGARPGEAYRQVTRIADTGPIGWKEVGVVVPTAGADTVHVRLDFLADAWRIRRIAVADGHSRPEARVIAASEVRDAAGEPNEPILRQLGAADGAYLETGPGQRFTISFGVGPEPESGTRTLMLAAQGYYSEWIRPDWIRTAPRPKG